MNPSNYDELGPSYISEAITDEEATFKIGLTRRISLEDNINETGKEDLIRISIPRIIIADTNCSQETNI